ncbi:19784_t:CDS:2, partial [Cetraspora pellucida]
MVLEIGEECAIELFLYGHSIWKNIWIASLKRPEMRHYVKKPDELFRLYCEKILVDFYHLVDIHPKIDRKIRENKFPFTFFKITKSEINSGIATVGAKAIRNSDGLEIWHMEVA